MTTRIGAVVLGVLTAMYAGYSWYMGLATFDDAGSTSLLSLAFIGGVVILLGVAGLGTWMALVNPRSADYLIDTDVELRKVVWPSVYPLFDPKAEAWGSTYVVILCTVLLTIFVWAVDSVYHVAITNGLFSLLFNK